MTKEDDCQVTISGPEENNSVSTHVEREPPRERSPPPPPPSSSEKEDKEGASDYLINHLKTFVVIFMIFGTIAVIVLIVLIHKWRFEGNLDAQERVWMFKDGATDIRYSVHIPGNPHSPFCNWPSIYDSPDNHMERHDDYIGVV